jgi:NADH-quinone oxidoreductase subunit J
MFYFFAVSLLCSGISVIQSKNPIYSVLSLIICFCTAAGLLILVQLDFFAMIFLVVYVGGIAVLFLFVVMMINIKIEQTYSNVFRSLPVYLPIATLIGCIFLLEIFMIINCDLVPISLSELESLGAFSFTEWAFLVQEASNIEAIGQLLYTYFCSAFLISSIILLVSMVGCISLTLSDESSTNRRQEVSAQNLRAAMRTSKA